MSLTQYSKIDELIYQIKDNVQISLKDNLIGLYLYGSATAGDFDPKLSDIDLVLVLKNNLSKQEFNTLEIMHNQLAIKNPEWKDRIEVIYISADDLKNFRLKRAEVAEISPGEPFHLKEVGDEWLISWYVARQNSITILGTDAKTIFPDISVEEYKEAIKKQAILWKESLGEYTPQSTRGSVSYAIFTLCRAMYSHKFGEQASKKKSAEWAATEFPQWKNLINEAIEWRKVQWHENQGVLGNKLKVALDFLNFSINQLSTN